MDPDRWRTVEELFHRALETPAADRATYLAAACGGDGDLKAVVERLLRDDARSDERLERWEEGALLPRHDPLIGRDVGPYRLTSLVGIGGMGVVYRAERRDGVFEREVAVKLIRIELASPAFVRRFEAERRTLAALHHPNIAQLLDGGTTAEGRPYLVMEFVHGVPIDRWCDDRRASVEERLRLFVQVCRGVHYAHQNLVVHRDLKPANVLVGDDGVPKLLDFGVARLLAESAERTDGMTLTGAPLVTPDYASPEQLLLGRVTTAMDVYSLGIVLYELLTGRRPFRSENLPPVEWQRAILERPPTRPSVAIAQQPASSRRRLRGDLDRIVLMALRKEPERRYGSAKELADDVEAHLAGRPVRARADSVGYLAAKFVQRNRIAVAAAAAVLVALVVGIVVSRRAEQRARTQAVHARIEADSFQRNGDFLLETLLASEVDPARLEEQRRRVLAQAEHVRREHAGQDHLRANLLDSLGRVAQRLGALDDAEALLEEARAIRERAFGEDSLEHALSLRSLGNLRRDRGEPGAAAELFARALAVHRARSDETHTDVAALATDLASCLRPLGRLDEAEALAREALELRRKDASDPLAAAESLVELGKIAAARGEDAEAARLLEEALETRRRIAGSDDLSTLEAAYELSGIASVPAPRAEELLAECERGARALRLAGEELLNRVLARRAERVTPRR